MCGWESTGTAFPDRLCGLPPWRSPKAAWMWSWTACAGWPCLDQVASGGSFPPQPLCESVTHSVTMTPIKDSCAVPANRLQCQEYMTVLAKQPPQDFEDSEASGCRAKEKVCRWHSFGGLFSLPVLLSKEVRLLQRCRILWRGENGITENLLKVT